MSELRSKKLDQSPPGALRFFYFSYLIKPQLFLHHFLQPILIFLLMSSSFLLPLLAKSEELPKKPLGQERPILLMPLQPDSPLEVKINLQPSSQPDTETQQTDSITLHQTSSPAEPQDSSSHSRANTPSLPSPDPVVVHTQRTPSPLRPCRKPPVPPKVGNPCAEGGLDTCAKMLPTECSSKENGGKAERQPEDPETQEEPVDWPPPYVPPALDTLTMQTEEEIMDLPDLPPPPLFLPEHNDQSPLDCESETGTNPETQRRSPSPRPVPVPQMKLSSKPCPKPPTPSKPSPSAFYSSTSSSSPRLPPPKPSKFPVSLYVPGSPGDRRPSNTSQYDNLSEADEEDRYLEKLLSTPEELPSMHSNPPHTLNRDYDPALYPLPPPPVFIPPAPSPVPPSLCALPTLPQEPEYEGGSWVEDSIIPPPPPSFADRLSPLQCSTASCSDAHRATSPSYSKPFSRAPRDHSAFPAPLLYTGSPPGHPRPSGQSAVGVPLVRSSPDFCRMPPSGQQLPKSVTF